MSIFSGVIPTVKVSKNSKLNAAAGGLLTNLATSTVSVAINQTLGAQVTSSLGLNPNAGSNFLGSVITPGLITSGIGALNQTVISSITNSRSLGPFGPLAGNLAQAGLNALGGSITQGLFGGLGGTSSPNTYFPGAGGPGESKADYGQGNAYTLGKGGSDVVFTIASSNTAAKSEAVVAAGTSSPGQPGAAPAAPAPATAAPAGAPNPGTPPPTPKPSLLSSLGSAAVAAIPTVAASVASSVISKKVGGVGGSIAGSLVGVAALAAASSLSPSSNSSSPDTTAAEAPAPTPQTAAPATNETPSTSPQGASWKFICAPEDISWETSAQVDRVAIFGANYAPVQAGTRGMRELSLNGAIVEGFCRNLQVEDKIKLLEDLMKMRISEGNRYLQIPVYRITANNKRYGEGYKEGGHYVIKSIKVQEKMRDLQGNTTRAVVDVSFTQVPAYQVETGRDIASPAFSGAKGPQDKISSNLRQQAQQAITKAAQAGAASRAAAPGSPAAQAANTPATTTTPTPPATPTPAP